MMPLRFANWKFRLQFRSPRIAEFPFVCGVIATLLALCSNARAQSGDLPDRIKRDMYQFADSLFKSNGEVWSGLVWSSIPEFRRTATDAAIHNGILIDEITVEERTSSFDPTGNTLSLVRVKLSGNILLKEGKIIPFEVERAIDVLHSGSIAFADRYPDLLKKDSSLWTNVILPGLVALGAAAIIALFFFVRS